MKTALLIEDDAFSAFALRSLLEGEGIEVVTCLDTDAAREAVERRAPDLLVADWCVGGGATTPDIARLVRARNPQAKLIFVTGYPQEELQGEIRDLEPFRILSKPVDFDELLRQADREIHR
jgi:CheY-like chemotaxis protein